MAWIALVRYALVGRGPIGWVASASAQDAKIAPWQDYAHTEDDFAVAGGRSRDAQVL
jgi:hypothetical protein